ncbi:MAG: hypothetical protein KF752_18220 [Pirellulaceae bacterium]|nr:hypothetical protein [Pirellulaceae bacterium]
MSFSTQMARLSEIDSAWKQRAPMVSQRLLQECQQLCEAEELAELLAADSEWRWRLAGPSEMTAEAGIDWRDRRPRAVETYLQENPELGDSLAARWQLIESEFMSRSRWGNPPLISTFVERFPEIEDLEKRLRNSLDELSLLYVRLVENGDSLTATSQSKSMVAVKTPLSIGRRAFEEPRDTFVLPGRRRLIMVDNDQHGVSRQHALIIRQSLNQCQVVNTSPCGRMKVNGGEYPPGSHQSYYLPVTVEIAGRKLQFFQQ